MARDPYGDHNPLTLLLLSTLFLLLLTHGVTYFRTGPLSAGAAIDRFNIHSIAVAHCTHTTEPMASHSHSGGPTAFRQNPSIATALSRPLRPNPQRAGPGWPRVYQRHPDHRRGQLPLRDTPTRGLVPKISKTSTQGYVRLPDQGKHAHNLP